MKLPRVRKNTNAPNGLNRAMAIYIRTSASRPDATTATYGVRRWAWILASAFGSVAARPIA